jgi:hypothetical protein
MPLPTRPASKTSAGDFSVSAYLPKLLFRIKRDHAAHPFDGFLEVPDLEICPIMFYFVFQSTFMESQHPSLEALQDIKKIMERSSRFISLSGLSGLSAGICALVGAYVANGWIASFHGEKSLRGVDAGETESLKVRLILLAIGVLGTALLLSFYFTWRKASRNRLPIWDHTSRKLLANLLIPLAAGGLFVVGLLYHNDWRFVAPACLVFYGLALVNASKYTLRDIRYLGLLEIGAGLINMYYADYGLYFWAVGFGVLHIVYGLIMWWKYDMHPAVS